MLDGELRAEAVTVAEQRSQEPAARASRAVPAPRRSFWRSTTAFNEIGVFAALVLMVVFIGGFNPGFLSQDSLVNVSQQAAFFGIMALGMVFLLSMREIDLSVGAIYSLTAILAAVLIGDGMNPWLAAAVGVLAGVGLGGVNGVLSNVLKISTIIVTLGSLSMYRGLTLIISGGRTVADLPREHAFFRVAGGSALGIPAIVWALLVLTVALSVLYRSTRFGFVVRAIGSNEQAARLSGIPIERVRLLALMLTGGLSGLAGVFTLAFFQSADTSLGLGYELLVIAAAIIGGTALSGGSGTVLGALIGALMIAVIRSGLIQFGVTANWSTFATGAVIIAAVALDALIRRRRTVSMTGKPAAWLPAWRRRGNSQREKEEE